MVEGPRSETCVCGSTHWHALIGDRIVWCKKCGSLRVLFEPEWTIPLDRVGDMPRRALAEVAEIAELAEEEEAPTSPGTPEARKRG